MLFESIDVLNEMICLIRSGPQHSGSSVGTFRDIRDPEIDKLYCSSPFETELSATFEIDTPFVEDEKKSNFDETNPIMSTKQRTDELFKPQDIPLIPDGPLPPSSLSLLLKGGSGGSLPSPSPSKRNGGVLITIYLPNREPMEVRIDSSSSVDELIRSVLSSHQRDGDSGLKLHYHAPECYELRLHEGDGEPDEDFPAIDRHRALKQVGNVTEFCLCQMRGVTVPPSPSPTPAGATSSRDALSMNMIRITLPNADHIKLRLEEGTTCRDILPSIAKKHRIELYTADYVFRMLPADQTRLKLSSPDVDPDKPILQLKVQELDLQKKVYADTPKEVTSSRGGGVGRHPGSGSDDTTGADLSILYTDVTAAVYQEWPIVKKNKFGRMQERMLGIDESKIYNAKRDGTTSVVHRAQRDISTVRKVDALTEDKRAFRITFEDDGEVNDIEYFCETIRDCAEIVAKINYLIAKRES